MKSINYLTLLLLASIANATVTSIATQFASQICTLKYVVYGLLPPVAFVMFLLAGLVYAAGQAFGAETKAKAQGWAISMLVGGIIGIILVILAPAFVNILTTGTPLGDYLSCTTS